MKKLIYALVACLLLPTLALAGTAVLEPIAKQETISRYTTSAVVTADTAVKATPGYVKYLSCIGSDAAATAGTIRLYDNTAESGTLVVDWDIQALAYSTPVIFPVERDFTVGIYLGYTTTADVKCYVTYR